MYDLIVIGAGPAGLSAAFFAASEGLKVALIGKPAESQLVKIALVKNYPGFPQGIPGPDLIQLFVTQAHNCVADLLWEHVFSVESQNGFVVATESGKKLPARCLVFALGQNEFDLTLPAFGTPGIFLAGAQTGTTSVAQAVGSGATVAAEAVRYVRTVPSLKLV